MKDTALTREDMIRIIEGKGAARRIPLLFHPWISAGSFGEEAPRYQALLDEYPCDAQFIPLRIPDVFLAPQDAPSYRWLNIDNPFPPGTALDAVSAIRDWSELDGILEEFPDPWYPGLIPHAPPKGNTYRVAQWWYWLFERFWSLRGMENALCDFYESPESVHRLFRALTDFYKVLATRAHDELGADAIWTSDDIGTQTGPFFSPAIFQEFFQPYYRELVEHVHSLGMHMWMHCCGNILPFLPDLVETGLDVLHPIQKYTMDEQEIAKKYGDKLCIWAGFDVQQIIPYGTPDEVRAEVRHLLDTYYRPQGRLMMTAGNGMTPDTPFDSLEALLDETLRYGTLKCGG